MHMYHQLYIPYVSSNGFVANTIYLVNYLDLERLLDLEPPLLHEKSDKMTTKSNLSRIILRFIKLISDFLMDFLGNQKSELWGIKILNNCLFLSILPNVIETRD